MGTMGNGSWTFDILKMLVAAIFGGLATLWLPFVRRFFWGPELSLSFGNEIGGCVEKTPIELNMQDGSKQKTEGYYIRILVRNIKPNLGKDCRVFLVGIEKKDNSGEFIHTIYRDSIQLQWSCRSGQGFSSIDLPTEINQFVDVISTIKGVNHIVPKIEMVPFRYNDLFFEHGTFRYSIQVSGQEIEPRFIRIILDWNGQWDSFNVELDPTPFPPRTRIQEVLELVRNLPVFPRRTRHHR